MRSDCAEKYVKINRMKEFFKKVSEQITTSIKFLINPSSWRKGYEQGKEYFPHLKTLVTDDIDVQKIAEFVTKNRKEQQVYKIIFLTKFRPNKTTWLCHKNDD